MISDLCKAWEGFSVKFCPLFVRKRGTNLKCYLAGKIALFHCDKSRRGSEMRGQVHRLSVLASSGTGFGQKQSLQRQKCLLGS